jgi:Mg-chelatase subunit ChlD
LLLRIFLICSICLAGAIAAVSGISVAAQRGLRRPETNSPPKPRATPPPIPRATPTPTPELLPVDDQTADPNNDQQDVESVKTDTNLVTIPVIASTRDGIYVPDLVQNEFSISEDGKQQQIAFFAAVSAPFHVVLLLDTSASTEEKLGSIRRAAATFVEQLQSVDRVKVISFDTELRELCEFTNDRAELRKAIYKTASGKGTRLYDAFELALASVRAIKGRKAIVIFTDGMDFYSDRATFDSSLHGLDEEGVIVYPIRYETRAETERIAREATDDPSGNLPTIDVIRPKPGGTTPTTFPGDDPNPVPTSSPARTGPFGLPSPDEIMRRRRERDRRDRDPNSYPDPNRLPPDSGPTSLPDGRTRDPRDPLPDPRDPRSSGRVNPHEGDAIDVMLDQLYLTADSYLAQLAEKSGGRVLRADTISSLPDAFAKIAAELRTQYAISYYPVNKTRDGLYRKVKVTTSRKNVAVRARPGYRAPSGG